MELIVALDLLDGSLVRLRRGSFSARRDFGDPRAYLDAALTAGVRWFHVVDLARARDPRDRRHRQLVASLVGTIKGAGRSVEVGGGLRRWEDVAELLDSGADRVVLGTVLARGELVPRDAARVVAALDYRRGDDGAPEVVAEAWTAGVGRTLDEVTAALVDQGISTQLVTAVDRDGTARGPDLATYRHLVEHRALRLIASGGVASLENLRALARLTGRRGGVEGVVVGTALLDGTISFEEALDACGA